MSAKIVQFPLATPVEPPLPMSESEEFFWRQVVARHAPQVALDEAYALAAAEALAFRAGVIFEWEWHWDTGTGEPLGTLIARLDGVKIIGCTSPEADDNAQRVTEARMARRAVLTILHYLDSDPDPEDQPLAEWERELLVLAA